MHEGLYSPERTAATYDGLLDRAADLAASLGARVTQVRCTVPRQVSLARLAERRLDDEAVSDADAAVYEAMAAAEAPWPQALTLTTTGSPDLAAGQVLAAIASSAPH